MLDEDRQQATGALVEAKDELRRERDVNARARADLAMLKAQA